MNKKRWIIIAVVACSLLIGYNFLTFTSDMGGGGFASSPQLPLLSLYDASSVSYAPTRAASITYAPASIQATAAPAPTSESTNRRLVIQTAEISIVANDTIETVNIITRLANETNGFVVSSEISNYRNVSGKKYQSASIVIRIPSEKLEDSLNRIKKLAVEVNNERVRGQDVTSDYVDLKSRLGNLETAEKQLQEILKNSSKADEVLNTFKELVKVREEIEVIKGRMKYYEESASLSSISISITPSIASTPIQVGWKPEGTVKQAAELFIETLQGIADFLIVFAIARLPFLIVFGVPAFFLGRWGWRKYQARKKPTPSE